MQIILSPVASNYTSVISIDGLTITVDGVPYDLSVIPIGGQADGAAPFVGITTREKATIQYRYDSQRAVPVQSTSIADFTYNLTAGEVPCPIKWRL